MNSSPSKRSIIMAAALTAAFGTVTANAQKVYWTDLDARKIQRANLDGSDVEDLIVGEGFSPIALDLDLNAGKMYFGAGGLKRANLDGSQIEVIVSGGPRDIALDLAAAKIYWTDASGEKIRRADLDGANVEDLVTAQAMRPRGIALDHLSSMMYWTDTRSKTIQRADFDGSNVEIIISVQGAPHGIALDPDAGKLYWTDMNNGTIRNANLDGSNIEVAAITGLWRVSGIGLDLSASKMYVAGEYWDYEAQAWIGKIQRAGLDGANVEDLVGGLGLPWGIALDPTCTTAGPDCQPNGIPDPCEVMSGATEDCNDNGIPDQCDLTTGASKDCNSTGIPDECENDCNENGLADECDIADGSSDDCNANLIPDECEPDCNNNTFPDDCDIFDGVSDDCTSNGVPDECEPDCNGNGEGDTCDIADGTSEDCTADGVPDECEPDCNGNDAGDTCDIADGTSVDCDDNGIPDECEPDCNGNGMTDSCDITGRGGVSTDCDNNGVPDECDLADGRDLPCAVIVFAPRGSTGPFEIVGNEMIIPEGGLQVEYEILVSGWGNAPGSPLFSAFNMVFDEESVLGSNADPPDPGVNLATPQYVQCTGAFDCPVPDPPPVTEIGTCGHIFPGYCDDFGGAFFLVRVCSNDQLSVCLTDADCQGGGQCIDNPRFVFPSTVNPLLTVITLGGDRFQWLGISSIAFVGVLDPDGVSKFLTGNLRLIVPAEARGTYDIRFFLGEDFTFLVRPNGRRIPSAVIDGKLTIGGACCLQDEVCEILLEDECDFAGGEYLGGFCGDDSDNDGHVDVCDPCPNDNPDDTDGDGVCDSDDSCPFDPNKIEPGLCGCGVDDNADSDGDGISDCDDQCPGIDDTIFAPDCVDSIPTVSTWGIVILTLLLLTACKVYFGAGDTPLSRSRLCARPRCSVRRRT